MKTHLRKWKMDDAYGLMQVINNKRIHDNLRDGLPFPYTLEDARNYIEMVEDTELGKSYVYAIVDENDGIVGNIGIFRQENIHFRSGEMGYFIGEPFWGKGVCTKAVEQICDKIFLESDIVRIFAEPFSRNAASRRVLEKAGFNLEGIMRKYAYKNGQFEDMCLYALIRDC
ncbi:GNAT family N-acetyltransferase [Eubacteriaceae bacterium ES3]|nr:GNAT family N-acetyltransferase [Eubacteriaceae bacterium ES3]